MLTHLITSASTDASCSRVDYELATASGTGKLAEAIASRMVEERLPRTYASAWRTANTASQPQAPLTTAHLDLEFEEWRWSDPKLRSNAILGDISETAIRWLRDEEVDTTRKIAREKREALSSATSGWDLLEIFEDDASRRWFILWEVKGTDQGVEQRTRAAARQLDKRAGRWLAKLSKLLEDEIRDAGNPSLAAFASELLKMKLADETPYHTGIAVVADMSAKPSSNFAMFANDKGHDPARSHSRLVLIPNYSLVRGEIRQWILG